jgi:hydrophobic/amphiphilic exporter-1 (mainly G- bacteria), HAE1 family
MSGALRVFVARPVFTWVLMLAMVVAGLATLRGMPVERYPSVDVPIVTVTTVAEGLSSGQVETDVTSPIEEALGTIGGLTRIDSTSQEGVSIVMAQFALEKPGAEAAQEARDKLARVSLPRSVGSPRAELFDANAAPILMIALTSSRSHTPVELTEIAERRLKRDLASIDGVGSVRISGGAERTLRVELSLERLESAGLTVTDVTRALQIENLEAPGGAVAVGDRERVLRVDAKARTPEELGGIVIGSRGTNAVRLSDVAELEDTSAPPTSIASLSGTSAIILSVTKRSGANTLEVLEEVRERLESASNSSRPDGVELTIVRDEGVFVEASLHAVEEHLVLGSIFAALVILLFLRSGWATVISALAIPTSVIGTFAVLGWLGISLNMLSLLGLTLAVGIVIDDAVVVIENVYRILEAKRLDPVTATLEATREISLAVLATTLSLVAVFLPIGFMSGIVGRFLSSFGLTMSVSILLSLVVAFTLTPMLCARWLKTPPVAHAPKATTSPRLLERGYEVLLRAALRRPKLVAFACCVALLSILPLGAALPKTFVPYEDEARFEIYLRMPPGTLVEQTSLVAERAATLTRTNPEVERTVTTAGAPENDPVRGSHEATVYVSLQRRGVQKEVVEAIRARLTAELPSDVLVMVSPVSDFGAAGPDGAAIQFVLSGDDLGTLDTAATALLDDARQLPGTTDHGSTSAPPARELAFIGTRERMKEQRVSHAELAELLGIVGRKGAVVGAVRAPREPEDSTFPAVLSLRTPLGPPNETSRPIAARSEDGRRVYLPQLGSIRDSAAPPIIRRTNRQRQVTLFMNTVPGTSDDAVVGALEESFRRLDLPPGYRAEVIGNASEMEKASEAFLTAILLSFVFMYLVIAAQFESWLHPITILASLPLTLPFALASLLVGGQSLNLFSALGFLVLFGIVKKNSILQVDHILALRARGMDRTEAVIRGNVERLRPILMTTVAFVAGLLPLVVSSGPGSGTNRAIAVGLVGGQTLALLLTLLATPVLYVWLDDVREAWTRWRRQPKPESAISSAVISTTSS